MKCNLEGTFTFKYFFHIKGEKINVCKSFYQGVLGISLKLVSTPFNENSRNQYANYRPKRKNEKSRRVPTGDTNAVPEHILSFPAAKYKYFWATTSRSHLRSDLRKKKINMNAMKRNVTMKTQFIIKNLCIAKFITN